MKEEKFGGVESFGTNRARVPKSTRVLEIVPTEGADGDDEGEEDEGKHEEAHQCCDCIVGASCEMVDFDITIPKREGSVAEADEGECPEDELNAVLAEFEFETV